MNKPELEDLYLNQKKGITEIGKLKQKCRATVYYWLKKHGIPTAPGRIKGGKHYSPSTEFPKGIHQSPETEFRKGEHPYPSWNKGHTKATDPRLKIHAERVSQKLKGGSHQDAKFSLTKEFYENLYYQDGLNLGAIARLLGCDIKTVHYYFRKYGIPCRERIVAMRMKPSGAERRFMEIIEKYNLPFAYVGDGKLIIDGLCPDFVNTNGRKQLIEIFGTYWHEEGEEEERKRRFVRYGFDTIVIWEPELADEQLVLKKVQGGVV